MARKRKFDDYLCSEIIKVHRGGTSQAELARAFGVSRPTIRRIITPQLVKPIVDTVQEQIKSLTDDVKDLQEVVQDLEKSLRKLMDRLD